MQRHVSQLGWFALAALAASAVSTAAAAQHAGAHAGAVGHPSAPAASGGAHQHVDSRFAHNHYYFDHGYAVHRPPGESFGELHGRDGGRYYYHGGNWYRWRGGWYRWWGGAWVVWGAPIGLFVPYLPPFYTTVWWGGIPYYYANDTYYLWRDGLHEYEVVAPPEGIESAGTTEAPPSDQLFVYPKTGQSAEQQSQDRFECHRWAVERSGYDPTSAAPQPTADNRHEYLRAESACLEGRGYTVR